MISPPEVSALILAKMIEQAAKCVPGGVISGAVITVPAYFNHSQRVATRKAARLAGIKLLGLLNEPTAALLHKIVEEGLASLKGITRRYLVYDFGGGTLDVSAVEVDPSGMISVLATSGDMSMGGADITSSLVMAVKAAIAAMHHTLNYTAAMEKRLWREVESGKKALASSESTM